MFGFHFQEREAEDLTPNPKKSDWGLRILLFQAFDFLRPERPASNLGNRAYFRPGMGWIGSFSSAPTSSVSLRGEGCY